jgi:hypothetical protein
MRGIKDTTVGGDMKIDYRKKEDEEDISALRKSSMRRKEE